MKNILFIFLLITVSISLFGRWRWIRVNSLGTPEFTEDYHVVYDENSKKIILKTEHSIYEPNTFSFDGRNWEPLCIDGDNSESYGKLDYYNSVYDRTKNQVIDFRRMYCGFECTATEIFSLNSNSCWESIEYLYNGGTEITYDIFRKRSVITGWIVPNDPVWPYYTAEFDGSAMHFHQLTAPLTLLSGYITYDSNIQRTVFVGNMHDTNDIGTMEWDGETWEAIEAPFPSGISDYYGPIIYHPILEGVLAIRKYNTLLYKNHEWSILIEGAGFWGHNKLIYFPPSNTLFLFNITYDGDTRIYKLQNVKHSRPFSKPE